MDLALAPPREGGWDAQREVVVVGELEDVRWRLENASAPAGARRVERRLWGIGFAAQRGEIMSTGLRAAGPNGGL